MGDEASQEDEAGVERVIEQNKCVGREREGLCCVQTRLLCSERLWSHIEQPSSARQGHPGAGSLAE